MTTSCYYKHFIRAYKKRINIPVIFLPLKFCLSDSPISINTFLGHNSGHINQVSLDLLQLLDSMDDVIFKAQYGFCDKHSTQHAILDIVNTIQSNMDKPLFTCGILIGF